MIWGEYEGPLRSAVLALKHAGRDDAARPLGVRLAARTCLERWSADLEVIVPVASHTLRRIRRGWPAASLLGFEVGRALRLPVRHLLRRQGLRRQVGRSRVQRLALPSSVFRASPRVAGRGVLLVDDVLTTGTTMARAAEALHRAGAASVHGAVMAHAPDARRLA